MNNPRIDCELFFDLGERCHGIHKLLQILKVDTAEKNNVSLNSLPFFNFFFKP